jgi:hypothetical protein
MDASIKTIVSVRVPPVVFRYADSSEAERSEPVVGCFCAGVAETA